MKYTLIILSCASQPISILFSSCLNRKYNTLIQAQARELSHLRQRMKEGRSICHILTHHLSDTTKAFEELLRANDIDYYMGQSFREQLSQSSSLAQRVSSKMSGRERSNAQHSLETPNRPLASHVHVILHSNPHTICPK